MRGQWDARPWGVNPQRDLPETVSAQMERRYGSVATLPVRAWLGSYAPNTDQTNGLPIRREGLLTPISLRSKSGLSFGLRGRLVYRLRTTYHCKHRQVAQLVRELPLKRECAELLVRHI